MAIAVGTSASNSGSNTATLTIVGFTVNAGSNLAIVVAAQIGETFGSGDDDVTSVVWNSAPLTRVTGTEIKDSNFLTGEWWELRNPTPATGDCVITCVGTNQVLIGEITNLSGVHQTVPFGTAATATGSGTTPAVAVTAGAGEVTIAQVCSDADVAITGRTGTPLAEVNGINSDVCGGSQYYTTSNPTVSWTTASFPWVASGIAVKAAAGGGSDLSVGVGALGEPVVGGSTF